MPNISLQLLAYSSSAANLEYLFFQNIIQNFQLVNYMNIVAKIFSVFNGKQKCNTKATLIKLLDLLK